MSTPQTEHFVFDAKLKADRDYWMGRLSRGSGESQIKLDFEGTVEKLCVYDSAAFRLEGAAYEKLARFSGPQDLSLYAVLLAAFQVCLEKYSGGEAISVGSPALGRADDAATAPNALAIASVIDGGMTFRTFLSQLKDDLKVAYAHQDYPITRLAKDLGIESAGNPCPFFHVALALKNIHTEMPDMTLDLIITLERLPSGIHGHAKYRKDRLHRTAVERFLQHYLLALDLAIENADLPLANFELWSAPERQAILQEWNDTKFDYSGERLLHRLFEEQARRNPDAIAVSSDQENLTYQELNNRADQLAARLETLGVGPEVIVGICTERSIPMIVGVLGILKAGGAYLPMDPTYPEDRLKLMIDDVGISILLTGEEVAGVLPEFAGRKILLDTQWNMIAEARPPQWSNSLAPGNLAYVIYTSGSTGRPKGVGVSHWSASALVNAQIKTFEIAATDRVFQFASLGFDASVSEIFTALASGATLELGNPRDLYVGPFLSRELKTKEITTVTLPPSIMAETMADQIPALKVVVAAGEACAAATAARWAEGRLLINAYGPTEATVCASLIKQRGAIADPLPIGRPLENKMMYLGDTRLDPVPIGAGGEILVGGDGLARGYLGRPDLTAEKFVPDPTSCGGRVYRTGDLGYYLHDGNVIFLGRADRQVKIRGYRIEPGEIEHVLRQSPAVREAVVVVRANQGGEPLLAAYIVPVNENSQVAEFRAYLKALLPEHMIPAAFMTLPELPLTVNGKIDREKLPVIDPNQPELAAGYVAPRNPLESELAAIFGSVLGIEAVGVYDNFFERGGHSLLAVQLISRIRDLLEVDLDVIAVFEAPTVAELAVTVTQAQTEKLDIGGQSFPAEPQGVSESKSLSAHAPERISTN
jgi:amino acid adenylation domain-containing protein